MFQLFAPLLIIKCSWKLLWFFHIWSSSKAPSLPLVRSESHLFGPDVLEHRRYQRASARVDLLTIARLGNSEQEGSFPICDYVFIHWAVWVFHLTLVGLRQALTRFSEHVKGFKPLSKSSFYPCSRALFTGDEHFNSQNAERFIIQKHIFTKKLFRHLRTVLYLCQSGVKLRFSSDNTLSYGSPSLLVFAYPCLGACFSSYFRNIPAPTNLISMIKLPPQEVIKCCRNLCITSSFNSSVWQQEST